MLREGLQMCMGWSAGETSRVMTRHADSNRLLERLLAHVRQLNSPNPAREPDTLRHHLLLQSRHYLKPFPHSWPYRHLLNLTLNMSRRILHLGRNIVNEIKAIKQDYQDSQTQPDQPHGSQVSQSSLRVAILPRS
jgi:hypothetical protein